VSKSISYNVSVKGNEIGFHIVDAAACAGWDIPPSVPATLHATAAAVTDPVFDSMQD
jgi:hypothetical protein